MPPWCFVERADDVAAQFDVDARGVSGSIVA